MSYVTGRVQMAGQPANDISYMSPTLTVAFLLGALGLLYMWYQSRVAAKAAEAKKKRDEEAAAAEAEGAAANAGKHKKKHTNQKPALVIKKKAAASADEKEENHHELVVASVRGHQGDIDGCAMSPNGTMLASVGRDHTLRMWRFDPATASPITNAGQARIELKEENGSACAFSHDSKYLVVAMAESRKIVFYAATIQADKPRLEKKHEFATGTNHSEDIQTIIMSPGAHPYVLTVASKQDTHICLWSHKGALLQRIDTKQVTHYRAAMSADGKWFGVGTMLGDVKLFEVSYKKDGTFDGAAVAMSLKGHKRGVTSLCFGGNNGTVATSSIDGSLRVWDSDVRYEVKEDPHEATLVQTPSKTLDLVALSPLCTTMKRGRSESKATSPAATASPNATTTPHSNGIVACASGATLYFYRVNGTLLLTIDTAHRGGIRSIAFTHDGRHLISSGGDKHVKIWRLP